MKKPTKRYGISDDFGDIIRWVWDKPSSNYKFIVGRIKVQKEPKIDWNNFEIALF